MSKFEIVSQLKSGYDGWFKLDVVLNTESGSSKDLRVYQQDSVKKLVNTTKGLLKSPTGSGKSLMMLAAAKLKHLENPKLKFIFSAPQNVIAKGFDKEKFIWDKNEYQVIPKNLSSDKVSEHKVQDLVEWMLTNYENANDEDTYIVCTHATLVAAWKKLEEDGKLEKLSNLCLFIDEVHHVAGEGEDDKEIINRLGELVSKFRNLTNSQVHGCTATYLRGDQNPIFEQGQAEEIIVKIEDYLAETQINTISINIGLCDSWESGMDNVLEVIDKNNRIAVFIPPTQTLGGVESKLKLVESIKSKQQALLGDKAIILDLVTDELKKEAINTIGDGSNNNAANIINCQNMFKEGANWKALDTIVVMGERNPSEMCQILGRALRECGHTKDVRLFLLLKNFSLEKEDDLKKELNNYFKAIMLLQCGIDGFLSPKLDKFYTKEEKEKLERNNQNQTSKYRDILNKLFSDQNEEIAFKEDVLKEAVDYLAQHGENYKELKSNFQDLVKDCLGDLKDNLNDEELEILSLGLLAENRRRTLLSQFQNLSDIDFNALDGTNEFDWILQASKDYKYDRYSDLREVWCNNKLTLLEAIIKSKKYHDDKYNYDNIKNYRNCYEQVPIYCNKCKKIFYQSFVKHYNGQGCLHYPSKYTKEMLQLILDKKNITVLENVINTQTPVLVRCNICFKEWKNIPNKFINRNYGCSRCSGVEKKNAEDIRKLCFQNNLQLTGDYFGANRKTTFKCLKCNYEFTTTPSSITQGTNCGKCYGNIKLSASEIVKKIKEKFGDLLDCSLIRDPVDKNNLFLICSKCLKQFNMTYVNMLRTNKILKCNCNRTGTIRKTKNGKFQAQIHLNNKLNYLGTFFSKEEAQKNIYQFIKNNQNES